MNATFLQIFLLVNVFLIGIIASTAIRHAYAHFRPQIHEEEKPRVLKQTVHLSPVVKERLLQASQSHFQNVLDHSAAELQQDLKNTTVRLDKQLDKLGSEIIINEMRRYRADLEAMRKQAESTIIAAQTEVVNHQSILKAKLAERQIELEAKLIEEMAAEKQQLVQQIDTRLADSVVSFLTETLQHNVDLGAQSDYITTMLEEHKAEIIKGINDEI